jgi:outer membrane receptor protein involved in Fe transport
MYGATSFVGVIQVVRKAPGTKGTRIAASGGSYESGSGALSTRVPTWLGFDSSFAADFQRQGFRDDRTSFKKGHVLWRNQRVSGAGVFHFDLDAVFLRQEPASPSPRTGPVLSPLVPIDSNQNPAGAYLNQDRSFVHLGYDRALSFGSWSTTLAYTHSRQEAFRGFLTDVSEDDPNANGFRETIDGDDLYVDTHLSWTHSARWKAVAGVDYLYGKGDGQGGDFDYFVNLDGSHPPTSAELPPAADIRIQDTRHFGGLYGQVEWLPSPAWRIEAGARLNLTRESRTTSTLDLESMEQTGGSDDVTNVRPSGSLGVTWTAWTRGTDALRAFANWRNTFKPSAVDFGLDSEDAILKPETANSYEAGLKSELLGRALRLEVAGYFMDFNNLVVAQAIDGLPALANAGSTRFKGVELSASWQIVPGLFARGSYAWQDARFRDYLTEFDGVPTQLGGKRVEMSAKQLWSAGLSLSPETGLIASGSVNYMGDRYLNMRNTALAPGFATFDAGIGYRTRQAEFRIDGRNLGVRRDPVSESEFGDAQYYRMTARTVRAGVVVKY